MKFLANLMSLWALTLPLAVAKSCSSGQFLYSAKAECVPLSGNTSRDAESAPSGISCPISSGGWYWSSSRNYCAPSSSSFAQTPSCTKGFKWHSFGSACVKDTPSRSLSNCGVNEFWWSERESCLSSTYSPRTIPPRGSKCPTGSWTWNSKLGCCTPQVPKYSEPQCPGGWSWVKGVAQCRPRSGAAAPMPSGHVSDNYHKSYAYGRRDYVPSSHPGSASSRKRNHKSREEKLCPAGLNACPIESAHGLTSDYECLDTLNELTSCGGCASTGEGTDCTTISNARNVGCVQSTCVVNTCSAGFRPGLDKKSCVPL